MVPGIDAAAVTAPARLPPAGDALACAKRDLAIVVASLLAVLAWDLLGLDAAVSRRFGDAAGFAWREHWLFSAVLHDGARRAAWTIAAVLVAGIWQPLPFARGLARRDRIAWVAATLACALVVPALKQLSLTSCPWSLAEFGGSARLVSHWAFGQADGGPGRCFPAGHATAAFCFLPGWLVLRRSAPLAARRWLVATLLAGAVLAGVQVVRGAHFVSHSLWTGWCCLVIGVTCLHAASALGPAREEAS